MGNETEHAVYNDRATQHARRVVAGKVVSGKLHKLACQRHLDDLAKQNTEEFPYYYDVATAEKVLNFAETLTIAEGDEPKPVSLIEEQAFDLGCTFGWKKCSNNKRRFRRRYKSMARQNGKTFENGIMGTYIAGFGGYQYGKLFTVATKKRQARLAWEEMEKFIEIDDDLLEYFKIKDYCSEIECEETNCKIEALSKEAGLDEGFRSIFCSIDEIHQHKDNKIYKALYNGTKALPETLVSMITTRGDNINSFCKEMDDYCIRILQGSATAEDFFVDIYCLDDDDDIWDPNNFVKANPFICSKPEQFEVLKQDAETAKAMGGSDLRDFMIKSLNLWVENRDDLFADAGKFKNCGTKKTLEDFKGQACFVGLDLSSGGDLTSYDLEFDEFADDKVYFYSHSYMPRGRIMEHIQKDLAPYDIWEKQGLITVTGGEMDFKNDYKFIIKELHEIQDRYDLKFKGIGIDPHNADGVLADLEEFGVPVVVIKQSALALNDATQDLRLMIKSQKVEYDHSDELLQWSFLNAKLVRNSFGEMKIDKKDNSRNKRIDPVDAAIDAHALKLLMQKDKEKVDVNAVMSDYIKLMGWQ